MVPAEVGETNISESAAADHSRLRNTVTEKPRFENSGTFSTSLWRRNVSKLRRRLAERPMRAHHPSIKIKSGGRQMSTLSRRHFLTLSGSAAAVALSGNAKAAMGPN